MHSTDSIELVKCPLCCCGNPKDAAICSYCCAILDFGPRGQLVADGVVCPACGRELKHATDLCAGCHEPIRQMCPACQNENMRLRDSVCPDCGERRGDFFQLCRRRQAEAERKARREERKRPRIILLVNVPIILAFVIASFRAGLEGRRQEQIALLTGAASFLLLALLVFWRPKGQAGRKSKNHGAGLRGNDPRSLPRGRLESRRAIGRRLESTTQCPVNLEITGSRRS